MHKFELSLRTDLSVHTCAYFVLKRYNVYRRQLSENTVTENNELTGQLSSEIQIKALQGRVHSNISKVSLYFEVHKLHRH